MGRDAPPPGGVGVVHFEAVVRGHRAIGLLKEGILLAERPEAPADPMRLWVGMWKPDATRRAVRADPAGAGDHAAEAIEAADRDHEAPAVTPEASSAPGREDPAAP